MGEADQTLHEIMKAITALDGAPPPFIRNGKIVLSKGAYFVKAGVSVDRSIIEAAPMRGTALIFDDPSNPTDEDTRLILPRSVA